MKRYILISAALVCAISCKNANTSSEVQQTAVEETGQIEHIMTNYVNENEPAFEPTLISDNTNADGVRTIIAEPTGVCSSRIDIATKNDVILAVTFTGGCPGNTQGVAKLVRGMKIDDAIKELEGINCGGKGTSCPDQLAKTLKFFK